MESVQHSSTIRRIIGPTILLKSGAYFDFLDPDNSPFTIGDIAHGLAMTCRFAGQCDRFYSVAEHSVHASHYVNQRFAFQALMHDAAEAFIGDVSRPLKDLLPEYQTIERRIETAVLGRFGINLPLAPEVKEIDLVMLITEQHQMMRSRDAWDYTRGKRPLEIKLSGWTPEVAKERFLARFSELWAASHHKDSLTKSA
jgi:hypothetical protein